MRRISRTVHHLEPSFCSAHEVPSLLLLHSSKPSSSIIVYQSCHLEGLKHLQRPSPFQAKTKKFQVNVDPRGVFVQFSPSDIKCAISESRRANKREMLQYSKLQPAERLQLIEGAVTGRVSNLSDYVE